MLYSASAPGSGLLVGEYAVLQGYPALVCALERRLQVVLTPHAKRTFSIHASLGTYHGHLDAITVTPPFSFVLQAIALLRPPTGFTLTITGPLASHLGMGSSAAVVVATLGAFAAWLQDRPHRAAIFQQALALVRTVQGQASGADVAASLYGGVVLYQQDTVLARFVQIPAIHLVYVGYKFPTPQAIARFAQQQKEQPDRIAAICRAIGDCVQAGVAAFRTQNWAQLGRSMMQQQVWLRALGVSNAKLEQLIDQCQQQPGIYGAKISGAGYGDCVVALGGLLQNFFPTDDAQATQGVLQWDLPLAQQGLVILPRGEEVA